MHRHSGSQALANLLALLTVLGLAVYALEAWGVRTGVPQLAVCRVGHALVAGIGPGLLQLLLVGGVLLALPPWTRAWGISLLIAASLGMLGLGLWEQHALPYCQGSTYGGGSTP